jgi:outer membrane protein TolC
LKAFLGIKQGELSPDLRDVRRQVLGNFDANAATLEQARTRSWELKINDIKKKLQEYHITVAKTRLLPVFFGGVQSPDPLSLTSSRDMFFYLGVQVPVWDGLKRYRDISRQKVLLKEIGSETESKELDLRDKWMSALEDIRSAAAAQQLAQSQEDLARLKERQAEIRYTSGTEPLPVLIDGRKGVLDAKKNVALKSLDYYGAILALRQLSGDLGYRYVDQSSWQN